MIRWLPAVAAVVVSAGRFRLRQHRVARPTRSTPCRMPMFEADKPRGPDMPAKWQLGHASKYCSIDAEDNVHVSDRPRNAQTPGTTRWLRSSWVGPTIRTCNFIRVWGWTGNSGDQMGPSASTDSRSHHCGKPSGSGWRLLSRVASPAPEPVAMDALPKFTRDRAVSDANRLENAEQGRDNYMMNVHCVRGRGSAIRSPPRFPWWMATAITGRSSTDAETGAFKRMPRAFGKSASGC